MFFPRFLLNFKRNLEAFFYNWPLPDRKSYSEFLIEWLADFVTSNDARSKTEGCPTSLYWFSKSQRDIQNIWFLVVS